MYATFRAQLRTVTLPQTRYLNKPTTETYNDLAKQSNFTPESITLPSGIQAHWLGDKNAKTTFVYFHGGGYVMPATIAHLQYLLALVNSLSSAGQSINCLVLAYTLAPEGEFPTQLREAVELLNHLVTAEHRAASSLILGGDSAGGNLTLSVLSHALHPHAAVPKLAAAEPFRAALLVSPWVSFDTCHASYARNAECDILPAPTLLRWSSMFLGKAKRAGIVMGDSYSEPLLAEPGWWAGASGVVDEVLVWFGGGEVFEDGIRAFVEKFTEGWVAGGGERKKVDVIVTPRNAHDEPIFDLLLGQKTKGPAAVAIDEWVKARL